MPAARVADVLHAIAHDPFKLTPIIASIYQPWFVSVSFGDSCCSQPQEQLATNPAPGTVAPYQKGYNVAEYLLEVVNDPPASLFHDCSYPTLPPQ